MRKNFLNVLLVGSFLSTGVIAADRLDDHEIYLTSQTSLVRQAIPRQRFGTSVWENFKGYGKDFIQSTADHFNTTKDLLIKRDVGTVVTNWVNAHLQSESDKFLRGYFKPKSSFSDEFDVEALRPLVEGVQNTFYGLIDRLLNKKPLYVYHPTVGKLSVFEDKTVARKLLEAVIPDAVPLKGMMISVADVPVIRDYLVRKINEATLHYLLQLYKQCTGKTVKQSVKNLINQLIPQASETTTAPKQPDQIDLVKVPVESTNPTINFEELDPLKEIQPVLLPTIDSLEEKGALSPSQEENLSSIWNYLEPRMNYFLRASITELMLPHLEAGLKEFTLELNHKLNSQKSIFDNSWFSSATMGAVSASFITGWNPYALLGAPLGMGSHIIGNLCIQSVSKSVLDQIHGYKNLYIKYFLDSLLPERKGEHYLYGLNTEPTAEERAIFARDYYYQTIQREQGLVRAILEDVSRISGVASMLNKVKGEQSYVIPRLENSPIANNEYAAFLLGKIVYKQKNNIPLTQEEEKLKDNLYRYPSYNVKQNETEIVKQWKENAKFKEYSEQQKERFHKAEKSLTGIYEVYAYELPRAFAAAYQALGSFNMDGRFALDFITVEDIFQELMVTNLQTLQAKDLDLLKRAPQDEKFLEAFLEKYLTNALPRNAKAKDIEAVFRQKEFIETLMSEYVSHFRKQHQSINEEELTQLKQSPLGFNLSEIELIELHARMNEEEKQQYLSIDSRKIEQANAQELELINTQVSELVKENTRELLDHYGQQLMGQFNMEEYVAWMLQHHKQDMPLTKEEAKVAGWLRDSLLKTKLGVSFSAELNKFKSKDSLFRQKVSSWIGTRYFYQYLVGNPSILSEPSKSELSKEVETPEDFEIIDSPTNIVTPSRPREMPLVLEEKTAEVTRFNGRLTALVSSSNPQMLGKVDLVSIINGLYQAGKIHDLFHISEEETQLIQKEIHAFKKQDLFEASAIEFFENNANLYHIMVQRSSQLAKDHNLFYSYGDVFDQEMKKKTQIVEQIMKRNVQKN